MSNGSSKPDTAEVQAEAARRKPKTAVKATQATSAAGNAVHKNTKPTDEGTLPGSPRPTWGPVAAIVVTVLSFFFANAGAGVLFGLIAEGAGWTSQQLEEGRGVSVFAQFLLILIVEALTLGLLAWFIKRRQGTLAMIGLGRRPRLRDLGEGALGFFVYFGLFIATAVALQTLLPINVDQKQELGFETFGQPLPALALIFVSLAVLPPITEEILFRGFLFSGLRRGMGVVMAVLLSSVMFGALHLLGGVSGEGLLWIAAIDTFVLAIVLCYLRIRTGSLWAPILVHAAKNSFAFVSLFILHVG